MHVHASDSKLTEGGSAKFFVKNNGDTVLQNHGILNVRESKHAQSDADFLSKMSIAYKEADETDYWLNLSHDNGYLNDDQFLSLSHDCDRILKVLTSIVKTRRKR